MQLSLGLVIILAVGSARVVGLDFRWRMPVPVGESCTSTSYLLPAVCGGVGQLINKGIKILPSLSWVLGALFLCVAVMTRFW